MKKAKKWWIPLLLGAMLMAVLVGVVWARPKSQLGASTYKITIPGSAFHANDEAYNWSADYGWIHSDSGSSEFSAAVPMPPGTWTVQSVSLYVDDGNATLKACVELQRVKVSGISQTMAYVCSPAGVSAGVQGYKTTAISPSVLKPSHAPNLQLFINGPDIDVWAVRIVYY